MAANEPGDLLLEVLSLDSNTLGKLSVRKSLSKSAGKEVSLDVLLECSPGNFYPPKALAQLSIGFGIDSALSVARMSQ